MQYSQARAIWAITKASLRSTFRSPSAVAFSVAFPFIFILVFGFIGSGSGRHVYNVRLAPGSDTANPVFAAMQASGSFNFVKGDSARMAKLVKEGKLAGTIEIQPSGNAAKPFNVRLQSTTASGDKWPQLRSAIDAVITEANRSIYPCNASIAAFDFKEERDIQTIREYKTIDFILPGQLGFSLLSAGVFGVAFMFFNLRNTLVLKRFFATPVSRTGIVLGEAFSRVIFQLVTAVVIILVGHYWFGFTLINGFVTVLQMLFLSFLGLLIFMGFGFIVSGIAKSESTIPPMANIFTLPQFLLAGTFFSIDVFPKWLQPISRALPLTYLNDALREVAFEGAGLWDVRMDILILLAWFVATYFIAVKVFRWE